MLKGNGKQRPRDYEIKGDQNAPPGGIIILKVDDGRVDEKYARMRRRNKYHEDAKRDNKWR